MARACLPDKGSPLFTTSVFPACTNKTHARPVRRQQHTTTRQSLAQVPETLSCASPDRPDAQLLRSCERSPRSLDPEEPVKAASPPTPNTRPEPSSSLLDPNHLAGSSPIIWALRFLGIEHSQRRASHRVFRCRRCVCAQQPRIPGNRAVSDFFGPEQRHNLRQTAPHYVSDLCPDLALASLPEPFLLSWLAPTGPPDHRPFTHLQVDQSSSQSLWALAGPWGLETPSAPCSSVKL